jgi:hypothetical protein
MGPKIGARSTGSPRTASARPTCCGPARCATSVKQHDPAQGLQYALCAPMLGRLAHLPSPQRDALSTAFG